jgi:hypothetical protein
LPHPYLSARQLGGYLHGVCRHNGPVGYFFAQPVRLGIHNTAYLEARAKLGGNKAIENCVAHTNHNGSPCDKLNDTCQII